MWAQKPPDLGRQYPFVTRYFAQRVADTRRCDMIVIFGSINVDLIIPVPRLPRPGETVLGGD
jgi:hypothetical protein